MKAQRFLIPALGLLALGACENFLAEEPESFFSPENFPASEADLNIAMGGVLSYFPSQSYYNRSWYFLVELPSDHTISSLTNGPRYEPDIYTMTAESEWPRRVWQSAYGSINAANMLIQRIPQLEQLPEGTRSAYLGASKFLRALNYFNLVRAFGEVPLVVEPVRSFEEGASFGRASLAEVYALIVADLQEAEQSLPARWPEGEGKPTRGAATAMLADAYLFMASQPLNDAAKWRLAADKAKELIDAGTYNLLPDYADLWLIRNKNSVEHVFSIQQASAPGDGENVFTTQSRPSGVGNESGANYWLTTLEFMDTFDDADERKAATFLTEIVSEIDGRTYRYTEFGGQTATYFHRPYIKKWFDAGRPNFRDRRQRTDTNFPVYRFAEVLLIHAEAENEANGPTAAAYASINRVRNRAGLPDLPANLGKDAFREAVKRERSFELAFEAKRFFDLVRWGDLLEVMRQDPWAGQNVQAHHALAPLPSIELAVNPNLTQNPGY